MFSTTIAQSSVSIQQAPKRRVYEYALTVSDSTNSDTQELVAAFTSIPSSQDIQQWLTGWNSCGYSLQSQPQLIRTTPIPVKDYRTKSQI